MKHFYSCRSFSVLITSLDRSESSHSLLPKEKHLYSNHRAPGFLSCIKTHFVFTFLKSDLRQQFDLWRLKVYKSS